MLKDAMELSKVRDIATAQDLEKEKIRCYLKLWPPKHPSIALP
jgi:hypothetical protein